MSELQKGAFRLLDWNQVQAISLNGKSVEGITNDGGPRHFEFATEEEARMEFEERSGRRKTNIDTEGGALNGACMNPSL